MGRRYQDSMYTTTRAKVSSQNLEKTRRNEMHYPPPPPPRQTKVWSTSGECMLTAWCRRCTSSSGHLPVKPIWDHLKLTAWLLPVLARSWPDVAINRQSSVARRSVGALAKRTILSSHIRIQVRSADIGTAPGRRRLRETHWTSDGRLSSPGTNLKVWLLPLFFMQLLSHTFLSFMVQTSPITLSQPGFCAPKPRGGTLCPPSPRTTLIPNIEVGFKWMRIQLATPNKMAPVFVDFCDGLVVFLPRQIRRFRHGFFSSAVLDWSLRSCLCVRHLWRQQIADNRRYLRRHFLPWTSSLRSQISLSKRR